MEAHLTPNARQILEKRYLRTQAGKLESIADWVARIARGVAMGYSRDDARDDCARDFAQLMNDMLFIPNTPCLMNAGTQLGQLAACFVLPIKDNMGGDDAGIFMTLRNAALIQQTGGGVGFDWSALRPKDDHVASSGGKASGPVSFLRIYDAAFGGIAQGGCLTRDTLVMTDHGLLRLDEIVDTRAIGWIEGHDFGCAATFAGPRTIVRTFAHECAPIYRVVLENGLTITGTAEHKVRVLSPDGGECWKHVRDLTSDDFALLVLGQYRGCEQQFVVPIGDTYPREYITPTFAYVIGRADNVNDGANDITFNVRRESFIASHLRNILPDIFPGCAIHSCAGTSDTTEIIAVNRAGLSAFLHANNFDVSHRVPAIIRRAPRAVVEQYLRGLFGDGSCFFTPYEMFAREIATLLIGTGCLCTLKEEGVRACWSIRIDSRVDACVPMRVRAIEFAGEDCTYDLEVADNHTYIANGVYVSNSRRGANMAVLRVDHPDIEEYVDCKQNTESTLTNFNTSIALTDKFMRAVCDGAPFDLVNPRDGVVARSVDARALMSRIAHCAHANGEPGVLFIDTINEENPVPNLYTICATNPCGEQALGPYENCCLGHVNLARHCDDRGIMRWDQLDATVQRAVKFLDCVVSANKYVPAVPQLREAALRSRRIGLGLTGLADVFVRAGVTYGSPLSVAYAEVIAMRMRFAALKQSAILAQELEAFEAIDGSIWDHARLAATLAHLYARKNETMEFVRAQSNCDDPLARDLTIAANSPAILSRDELYAMIEEHGIRNACLMSVAPTGTTSIILGVDGYGCEPIFSLSYKRKTNDGAQMSFCVELARETIARHCAPERRVPLMELIVAGRDLPAEELRVNAHLRALNATALKIAAEDHLKVQCALQKWVDNSISKTINCAPETTESDVQDMYLRAWQSRLKGIAIYRTGSRKLEVLTAQKSVAVPKKKRPSLVSGCTCKCETSFGQVFTTVNFSNDDTHDPFEVFVTVGKSGTEVQAGSEAVGRLISLILRLNAGLSASARVEHVIAQLRDIGGSRDHRDPGSKRLVRSIPDAVSVALEEIMGATNGAATANESASRDYCPQCHKMSLIRAERCSHCEECDYSAC